MRANLSVVTLGVDDLPRAVRFYRDGLGWRIANDWSAQGVAFLDLGGIVLALWPRADLEADAGVPRPGAGAFTLAHNTRDAAEVDAALREAARAGARIVKPAGPTPWGGYAGYFQDPDGHLWEVVHNPGWTLGADGRVERLAPPEALK